MQSRSNYKQTMSPHGGLFQSPTLPAKQQIKVGTALQQAQKEAARKGSKADKAGAKAEPKSAATPAPLPASDTAAAASAMPAKEDGVDGKSEAAGGTSEAAVKVEVQTYASIVSHTEARQYFSDPRALPSWINLLDWEQGFSYSTPGHCQFCPKRKSELVTKKGCNITSQVSHQGLNCCQHI